MPRTQTILTAFVASPSDVANEREILEEVITELNVTWSKNLGIKLELLRWETHTLPAVGEDPQDIINKQIGDDYDIFIGILWTKFGTPTPRAASGTLEEFERAFERYKLDSDSVKIMFYFNDKPISPSQIDEKQMTLVKKFKKRIQKTNVYQVYSSEDDFEKLARIHLSRQIQEFIETTTKKQSFQEQNTPNQFVKDREQDVLDNEMEDEEGFLDAIERGSIQFELTNGIINRLTSSMELLSTKINEYDNELNQESEKKTPDIKKYKQVFNRVAETMTVFSKQINPEVPIFKDVFLRAIEAYTTATQIFSEFDEQIDKDAIPNSLEEMNHMKNSIHAALEATMGLSESISSLPKITTRLNRAKRACVSTLDALNKELENAIMLAGKSELTMQRLIIKSMN